jgi:hypothetical protein
MAVLREMFAQSLRLVKWPKLRRMSQGDFSTTPHSTVSFFRRMNHLIVQASLAVILRIAKMCRHGEAHRTGKYMPAWGEAHAEGLGQF